MEPLDLVSVVLRAAAFIAALQAAGLLWFVASCRRAQIATAASLENLLRVCAVSAMVLVLAHRAIDAGRLAGEWSGILDSHLQTMVWSRRPGLSSLTCVAGLLLLGIAAGNSRPWKHAAGWVGFAAVVGSFALTGHTTEAVHASWLQCLVALHVGLAAYWIGAVIGLALMTRQSDTPSVARAAAQFSATAVWLVPLILPAGCLLIWGLIPKLASLRSPYGSLLLLKAIGFFGLIVLAARNRFRGVGELTANTPGAVRVFRRILLAEYLVICGVLAATATMTALYSWE